MLNRWLENPVTGWWLIGLFAGLHLALAGTLGLGVDEAHYALYGTMPSLSYFDHPPLVGWLHWLGLQFGHSEFWVRLPALLLWPLILWQVRGLCLAWYGEPRIANLSLLLLFVSPLIAVLGFGLVPDTPLIVCTLMLASLVTRLVRRDGQGLLLWLLLGLLLGLCGLAKYTAVFVALALLWVLFSYRRLYWLKGAGPWLAVLVAALLVLPVFYWNWQHHWLSFNYQLNHGAGGSWSALDSLRYCLILLVSFGPLLTVAALRGSAVTLADDEQGPARSFVRTTALLLLAVAIWSAGNGEDLPHWTVLSWVLLSPFAGAWWRGLGHWRAGLAWAAAALTALLWALVWWLLISPPLTLVPASAQAVRDLHGWPEAAARARQLRDQQLPGGQLWVRNWTEGSRLAWYSGEPVQVLGHKPSQFRLWWGAPVAPGLLLRAERRLPKDLAIKVQDIHCEPVDQLNYQREGITLNYFIYYACRKSPQ